MMCIKWYGFMQGHIKQQWASGNSITQKQCCTKALVYDHKIIQSLISAKHCIHQL